MRVIAGSAGGLTLAVPKSVTRPTTDRVREALFSSLADRIAGSAVLDLYAGSGAIGIEALSRGAGHVVFVDANAKACDTIRANLASTRLAASAEIRRADALDYLKRLAPDPGRFDLVFADPPYARDAATAVELAALLASESLASSIKTGGLFVLESIDGQDLPCLSPPLWHTLRERRYGGTRVTYLTRAESTTDA